MRTGFVVITMTLALAGLMLGSPSRAHAACEACNDADSGSRPGHVVKRSFHRSYRTKTYRPLPVELPGCHWRKMRLWDPDGQYFLVSRIQFCR